MNWDKIDYWMNKFAALCFVVAAVSGFIFVIQENLEGVIWSAVGLTWFASNFGREIDNL